MKAVRIDGQTPGGKRQRLADRLPLDTPFSIQVFPVYACNLACAYCIHSVPPEKRGFIAAKTVLDMELYRKFIADLKEFPHPLKMLRFAGTGEPLLHPQIAEMVACAKEAGVAESLDIVTNGLRLTHELSAALVAAGLGRIRISLQGLSDEAYVYTKRAGVFQDLVENIGWLYAHRGDTKIYVKIMDCALGDDEEAQFLRIFGDIADFIAVEHLIPAVEQIDYEKIAGHALADLTQNGAAVRRAEVCPQPFYMMQLNPDGMMAPCCAMETAEILGDVSKESVRAIWRGQRLRAFLEAQLRGRKAAYATCAKCRQYRYAMFEEDVLDGEAGRLLQNFQEPR